MCELLVRVNGDRIGMGHFALDMDDGQVQWRHAIDVEGGLLSVAMVLNLVRAGLWYCDHAFPAVTAGAFAKATPGAALALTAEA
jgi:hypothetical protein